MKKKVFFLSGLSESGKSQAGEWATKNGIFRLKIIYFEKLIAQELNLETKTKEEVDEAIKILYKDEYVMIERFKNFIYEFMLANKCDAISLESLYRANLAESFLNDKRFVTKVLFIETNLENRAKREYKKLQNTNLNTSYEEVLNLIKEKDKFKIAKGVLKVKNIATDIINNNISLNEYHQKILKIFQEENSND